MQKLKLNKRQNGFSLVELIIAIFLLSILIGVGAPAFIGLAQNNAMAEISNRFMSSIIVTRSEALSRNTEVVMCQLNDSGTACDVDEAWEDGWVIWVDLDNDTQIDDGPGDLEIIKREVALDNGYTINAVNNQFRNRITFNSNGEASGDFGNSLEVFRLCNPDNDNDTARLIYLNPVGHAWVNRTSGISGGVANCI